MSAADNRQTNLEVGVTELLFKVMVSRPVAPFVEDIKSLTGEDINAKNSTGRTMLHEAVILGKVDWAKELLGAGANEMVKDGDGKTALQLAEEMLSKHAGKKERKELCHMLDRPSVGSGSCGSSRDVGASKGTRRLISKVEESRKNALEGVKVEFNAMKNLQEEMKKGLDVVNKSLEGVKSEFKAMKNSQGEMMGKLNLMKNSFEGEKGEVDKLKTQLKNVEMKVDAIILLIPTLDKEALRINCIDGMMGKTNVFPSNQEKRLKMRKLYEKMYDEDSILSTILQFIRFNSSVEVHVDFESKHIGRIKPTLRDHDGREKKGDEFYEFADFEERKAYLGGNWNGDGYVIDSLALVLSQLCVLLSFGNRGLPYSKDGEQERELYKGIVKEAERKNLDGEELDVWIKKTALVRRTTQMGKEIYLHAIVPAFIARSGSSKGRSILNNQLPSLLEYFKKHVMTALRGEETLKRIAAEMVTRL